MVAPSQLGAPFRLGGLTKVSPYGGIKLVALLRRGRPWSPLSSESRVLYGTTAGVFKGSVRVWGRARWVVPVSSASTMAGSSRDSSSDTPSVMQ